MRGLMQDWPLTLDKIIDHAAARHGGREVVSRGFDGTIERTSYEAIARRARLLSAALRADGIGIGDRVATLAFNSARHLEAWYGIMGIGAVCHALNPRLHPDQLAWIINHAEDALILADPPLLPLLRALMPRLPTVRRVVVLGSQTEEAWEGAATLSAYESWIAGQDGDGFWGGFSEETAAGLCYTSGTTGDPKGVLYSHRSNFLHTFMTLTADVMGISARDTVLPIVPMFHANGWGVPFSAPAVGAKMVMPGARLDGASVYELLETERVTFSAAVPTVWQMLLQHLDRTGERISTLRRVVIGGSACPEALIRQFRDKHGVEVLHAWGMTETSPLGTVAAPLDETPWEAQMHARCKQGRPPLGIELRIVDDEGRCLPEDGVTVGHLRVRGGIVADAYFRNDAQILDEEGFFGTGDVASIDEAGFMRITDRAKDVIKSGGEWISSVEIENIAAGHPKAALAAVIGVAHEKWGERPLLLVQLKPGEKAETSDFLAHLKDRVARWWMPDAVLFVDQIPLGATGKIDKKRLRQMYAGLGPPGPSGVSGAEPLNFT